MHLCVQLTIASLITAAVIYALTLLAGRSRGQRMIAATLDLHSR
jgi:hypothetical protein